MKAVFFDKHGGVENLRYGDFRTPTVGPGEIRVNIRACALNYLDLKVREGLPGKKIPLPHIPGSDVAGSVSQVGPDVRRIKVGDRVMICPVFTCGRCIECLSGEDPFCPEYETLGVGIDGGYAEQIVVPEANAIVIGDGTSFEQAAAFPTVYLTAWHMLITRGGVRPGEQVLVLATGSGVGMAAAQLAKAYGARVIGTAGTDEKLAKSRELGVDAGINHTTHDIGKEARRLTDGRGVDLVIDHVGAATWEQCIEALANRGRLVTCGATTGAMGQTPIPKIVRRQLTIMGSNIGSRAELLRAVAFCEERKISPVIDSVFPLAEAAEAQRRMADRKFSGKLVIRI